MSKLLFSTNFLSILAALTGGYLAWNSGGSQNLLIRSSLRNRVTSIRIRTWASRSEQQGEVVECFSAKESHEILDMMELRLPVLRFPCMCGPLFDFEFLEGEKVLKTISYHSAHGGISFPEIPLRLTLKNPKRLEAWLESREVLRKVALVNFRVLQLRRLQEDPESALALWPELAAELKKDDSGVHGVPSENGL